MHVHVLALCVCVCVCERERKKEERKKACLLPSVVSVEVLRYGLAVKIFEC